jgi:hypothetical protein
MNMRNLWFAMLLVCLMQSSAPALQKPDGYDTWDRILTSYVHDGVVNYRRLKNNPADMKKFAAYLNDLCTADLKAFSKEELLAFWINAYNAFTIKLILDHYPVSSIKDIPNAWEQKIWCAAGARMSLNDIEQIKLRKELKDPRIHFALVCASKGCPDLLNRAYRAEDINGMLDTAARSFFQQPKNFRIQQANSTITLYLSQIFQWYGTDFGKTDRERIDFIGQFLAKDAAAKIAPDKQVSIRYIAYDWSLNGR